MHNGITGQRIVVAVMGLALAASAVAAQPVHNALGGVRIRMARDGVVMSKRHTTVLLQPYAPNVIRVSISRFRSYALAPAGYGVIAKPDAAGWRYMRTAHGGKYYSPKMSVTILGPPRHHSPHLFEQAPVNKFFGSNGEPRYANVRLRFQLPDGHTVVSLKKWFMIRPNHLYGDRNVLYDRRPSDPPFFLVGATFSAQHGEHYYGLGENQQGRLDHRDQSVRCWSDYGAAGGESFCVPFMVTNKDYGILWDNPSKTTVDPYFNDHTTWTSQVGQRVSFFVVVGKHVDTLYKGYRRLTGPAQLLPKGAYGFIQSKERYATQAQIMRVARGYRERHLPCDYLVVDFFWYPKMGQFRFVKKDWPDPAAMNAKLLKMGFRTMISVWPRFAPGSRYYNKLLTNGWFYHLADGKPTTTNAYPGNRTGSDIDMTNPEAAHWFWRMIDQHLIRKGFSAIWADQTEPYIPPNGSYYHVGPGTEYFNVYPLFETSAIYHGMRRDTKRRAMILARAAFTGAQRNGTIFWSSDISPTWNTLQRQVPTGLDVAASGIPYWTDDVGGFLPLPAVDHPAHKPLISPAGARDNVGDDVDYPELYVRWFEYGVFMPILRTHGMRRFNTVWSYGKQATPILEKYLRLRYALFPYIYSCAYQTYKTGVPYMRALFMDFPNDPKVDTLTHEYMFGPDFLVAPVTHQGRTSRKVYLPAGTNWYNYWTNREYHGGQTIVVKAPINIIPLFVRAGSILPIGKPVLDLNQQHQGLKQIRVYPGANGTFDLYEDNGRTYDYAKDGRITVLHWNNKMRRFTHSGAKAWSVPDSKLVKVIHVAD